MNFLGLVKPCTEYFGIQISPLGCFMSSPSPAPSGGGTFYTPGSRSMPLPCPNPIHHGHLPASICAIISRKWKLRPIGMMRVMMMIMKKCPVHICCLDYQWSRILRSAAEYMHSLVFIHALRNCDRNGRNYSFPHFCSLGLGNLRIFVKCSAANMNWILNFLLLTSTCSSTAYLYYIVTHLAVEYRQIVQILQAVTVDVSSLFLCVTVNILPEKKMLLSFSWGLVETGYELLHIKCMCVCACTHIKSINMWILISKVFTS